MNLAIFTSLVQESSEDSTGKLESNLDRTSQVFAPFSFALDDTTVSR